MLVKIVELVGPKCLSRQKGDALFETLQPHVGLASVTVDFEGVDFIGSQFLNMSLAKLLGQVGLSEFKERVNIINFPPHFKETLQESLAVAVEFYKLDEEGIANIEKILADNVS